MRRKKMTVEEGIGDIQRQFIKHPLTQHKVKVSPSEAAGSAELAWLRGIHVGTHESYLTLKREYPDAAKYLLAENNMDTKGNVG